MCAGKDHLLRVGPLIIVRRYIYAMISRRAGAAGIATKLGNHTFRATGITAYLKNGGTLEKAAQMANHASTRTTQLYDRRREELSLDEVERIRV
jgi:integrase